MVGSAWFHLVAAFVVFGLILTFIAKPYWVPSSSMENTLTPGDRILVNRLAYVGSAPGNGDVVVFDADTIRDLATFENPKQLAVGMDYVFVNGVAVIDAGKQTDALPGKVLRGPGFKEKP